MDYVRIYGYNCKVEKGKVVCGWKNGNYRVPYVQSKYGGWDNASRDLTPTQLRGRIARGTAMFH